MSKRKLWIVAVLVWLPCAAQAQDVASWTVEIARAGVPVSQRDWEPGVSGPWSEIDHGSRIDTLKRRKA